MRDFDGGEVPEDVAVILNKYGLALSEYTFYEDDGDGINSDYQMYAVVIADKQGEPTDVDITELEYMHQALYDWLKDNEEDLETIITQKRLEAEER